MTVPWPRLRFDPLRPKACAACLVLSLLIVHTQDSSAQQLGLAIDLAAGAAVPVGNTTHASGTGGAFGFGILHRLGDRVQLTTDFQYSIYGSAESDTQPVGTSTRLNLWRATAGLTVRVVGEASWSLNARGGLGVAGVTSGPLPPGSQEPTEPATEGLNEDVLAFTGGLELTRTFGSAFVPFLRVQVDGYQLGEELLGLAILNQNVPPSGWLVGVPIQLGVRLTF